MKHLINSVKVVINLDYLRKTYNIFNKHIVINADCYINLSKNATIV